MTGIGTENYIRESYLFIFAALFFSIGYLVARFYPEPISLYVSPNTPWGIFTSLLIYDGSGNVKFFLIFAFLFSAANAAHNRDLRVRRIILSMEASVLGAVIANFLNLLLYLFTEPNGSSYGQSGVVYGLMGAAGSMALFDMTMYIMTAAEHAKRNDGSSSVLIESSYPRIAVSLTGLMIILSLTFIYSAIDIQAFYSIRSGIDSFVHSMAFASSGMIFVFSMYRHRRDLLWETI
ncbi:hypothetical protein [Thermoplasma sp.]|uniref:hypothetical protein n=1 Tax=Thermoplasma sp. TaxID=1973142 RepID=UPI00126C6189|nr:hypothetical protein [Thermoplasma sp.]KAA8922160.1 MAG: hypothetical protein F6Q11_05690 [Thermoplasma sp.]